MKVGLRDEFEVRSRVAAVMASSILNFEWYDSSLKPIFTRTVSRLFQWVQDLQHQEGSKVESGVLSAANLESKPICKCCGCRIPSCSCCKLTWPECNCCKLTCCCTKWKCYPNWECNICTKQDKDGWCL